MDEIAVDDIAELIAATSATFTTAPHRYDATARPALMAQVLTDALAPSLRVEADGMVWCHLDRLDAAGFARDGDGEIRPWPRQRWIETIADRVDLDSVERACQRTHVHVAAEQVAPDGRSVVVTVNAAAREVVEVDVEDPGATARWERRYGIGAAAAMRVMAAVAASGGLGRADEVVATRSPITWSR